MYSDEAIRASDTYARLSEMSGNVLSDLAIDIIMCEDDGVDAGEFIKRALKLAEDAKFT